MVLLGDMPAVAPQLIARLVASFDPVAGRAICVATAADGNRGHPVLWGRQFFPEFDNLTGDVGAKALLARHASQVTYVNAGDNTPLQDIDTPQALEAYGN